MGFQGEQGAPGIAGKTGVPVSDRQLVAHGSYGELAL